MTAQAGDGLTQLITTLVRDIPDYPQRGVVFKDITPLLADGRAFSAVVDALAAVYGPVDKVAGIEVLTDAFSPDDRVLVIDDVLATGGTARATADLVQRTGAQVAGLAVLLELSFLNGRAKLPDLPVTALLTV